MFPSKRSLFKRIKKKQVDSHRIKEDVKTSYQNDRILRTNSQKKKRVVKLVQ